MDTKEAAWKQARATRYVARQAAYDAKRAAIKAAVERFDKERAARSLSSLVNVHRLENLIDTLAFDVAEATSTFNEGMPVSWTALKAAHRAFWEEGEEKEGSVGQ